MKKLLCCLLAASLLLLCGCGAAEPKEITVDGSFVIVADQDASQAALSLQTTLAQNTPLDLEIVTEAAAGSKTVTVAVDASLSEGQYRTRIADGNLAIEAQSALVLVMAMRTICQNLPLTADTFTLTAEQCARLSGTIDMANAPFLVLTQNIRYADDEGGNMVVQRAPRFNQLVQQYQPDIFCLQEDNQMWSSIVDKFFSENYSMSGMFSSGPGTTKGNRQAIFFRTERYEKLEEGAFMLSDTPDEPYTKLEDSKSIRHVTWVLLKDKLTAQELFVCNTHLDTQSDEVRIAQLNILLERLGSYMEQYPTVFVGDFNSTPDSSVYATMAERMADPHITAEVKLSDIGITYNNYGQSETPMRIDYMFYNGMLTATKYRIMTDRYDGYISDHYGVTTEYSFVK